MSARGSGRSDVVDITVEIRAETEKAVLVSEGTREAWLPRSQIEIHEDGVITLPEWLAIEKGLV